MPIYVKSATPFHAMDLRLRYDAAATFVGANARGDAAGAMTSTQAGDGQLAISLASADPIGDSHGSILLLQFRGANPVARPRRSADRRAAGARRHPSAVAVI